MNILCLTALAAMAVVCTGCSRSSSNSALAQTSVAPITVGTAKAQQRDLVDRIDLTGNLTGDEQVTVYAKVPGYLRAIRVDIGDHVQQGQLIAELDVPEMTTALAEKQA